MIKKYIKKIVEEIVEETIGKNVNAKMIKNYMDSWIESQRLRSLHIERIVREELPCICETCGAIAPKKRSKK